MNTAPTQDKRQLTSITPHKHIIYFSQYKDIDAVFKHILHIYVKLSFTPKNQHYINTEDIKTSQNKSKTIKIEIQTNHRSHVYRNYNK